MTYTKRSIGVGMLIVTAAVQGPVHAADYFVGSQFEPESVVTTAGTEYDIQSDPTIATTRLDWWSDDCRECIPSTMTFYGHGTPGQGLPGYTGLAGPFALGKLRFTNNTGVGDPGLGSVDLALSYMLDGALSPIDFIFGLSLADSGWVDRKGNGADVLTFTPQGETSRFNLETEDGSLLFTLLGWSEDDGQTFSDHFTVGDASGTKIKLYATVTPVPVPAAVWLFGTGLIALLGVARRH